MLLSPPTFMIRASGRKLEGTEEGKKEEMDSLVLDKPKILNFFKDFFEVL